MKRFLQALAASFTLAAFAQNPEPYLIETVAGTFDIGDGGPATQALLSQPNGLDFDAEGNLYIADRTTNRIRKASPDGTITTVAGSGIQGFAGDGGPATQARLFVPQDVAVDRIGNIYIADSGNNRIRMVATSGEISTMAGTGAIGFSGDGGPAVNAQLNFPQGIDVDEAGNLYIAGRGNNRIRRVTPDGVIETVAGDGSFLFGGDGGPATAAQIAGPFDVSVLPSGGDTPSGVFFIADPSNMRIRKVAADGTISTVAGSSVMPAFAGDGGLATDARLAFPFGLRVDAQGRIFIADSENQRVRVVSAAGIISTLAGTGERNFGGDGAQATAAFLDIPVGIAVQGDGSVYIGDSLNHRVRKVSPEGTIETVAGRSHFTGDGGPATEAELFFPNEAVRDSEGNLLISDLTNHRIRKVDPEGIITTIAGTDPRGFSGDGGPAVEAQMESPRDVAVDSEGNVYIADFINNRVRRVTTDGTMETFAGTGEEGFSGDGGPAAEAQINFPLGVAVDDDGNVYFSDANNRRIRKVTPDGVISTIAGTGSSGSSGDGGPAIEAELAVPQRLAVDPAGNVYVLDPASRGIRVIAADGTIDTIVAEGLVGATDVAVDQQGNLYILIAVPNPAVRKFTPAAALSSGSAQAGGIITTIAGGGEPGFSGDGGLATEAQFSGPLGVSVDSDGNVYVADSQNHRIRKLTPNPVLFTRQGNVNAASFQQGALAAATIVSLFGTGLAEELALAQTTPLPTELAGTIVEITDSAGMTRACPLFFVSPGQINYLVPPETALGAAQITVRREARSGSAEIQIGAVSPGLFAADASGGGVAAALFLRVLGDGSQVQDLLFDPNTLEAVPLELGPETDQVFLLLFGTGVRGFTDAVTATVGGENVAVLGTVPQGQFVGLDQINIGPLPRTLGSRGEVEIILTVDGKPTNPVTVQVR